MTWLLDDCYNIRSTGVKIPTSNTTTTCRNRMKAEKVPALAALCMMKMILINFALQTEAKGKKWKSLIPSLKYFVNLVRDELKIKYGGTRFQRYAGCPTEAAAILWMKREMEWTQTIPDRMPT